ncbi:MAG: pilin [Candidatus Peregrinibacteria bacterium]|nr:pilin [Candidatus Peregrinibacteria bacterium]
MRILGKITTLSALTLGFFLMGAGLTLAQGNRSVLDDIKGKLGSEGIAVVDYSTPEGEWGSLPQVWIDELEPLHGDFITVVKRIEMSFIGSGGLNDLRKERGLLIAEKSGITIKSSDDPDEVTIESIDKEIEALDEQIEEDTESVKKFIMESLLSNLKNKSLSKEEGANLIFAEVDFYLNYSRWGRLPSRLSNILEDQGYTSLTDTMIQMVYGSDPGTDGDLRADALSEVNTALASEDERLALQEELAQITGISASDAELIVDSSVQLFRASSGEGQLTQVGRAVANTIKNLAGALAVIWIVVAGIRLIFAQGDENTITEQKSALTYGGVGLVAILLVDRMIDVIYGVPGEIRTELAPDQGFSDEVYGLITFIKALIGTIAILFIVISGVKTLFATGEEDKITQQRKSIIWIGVGLIMIAIDQILVENFFIIPVENSDQIRSSNVTQIINTIASVFQFLLGFVGLIAFAALVYGAASMIMNYGNDEMVERAKKIIRNAIIGILVILSAYTIVATLVVFK